MKILMIAAILVSGCAVNAFAGDGDGGGQEGNARRSMKTLCGEANTKPEGGSGGETNAVPTLTGVRSGGNM